MTDEKLGIAGSIVAGIFILIFLTAVILAGIITLTALTVLLLVLSPFILVIGTLWMLDEYQKEYPIDD